jgi:protoporphyrinogen oxidase
MLGAAAARRLVAQGVDVLLLEGAPQLGGLTSSVDLPGRDGAPVTWDRFYHVVVGTDRRVQSLLDELRVGPIRWRAGRSACFAAGLAYPASSPAELAALPFLSPTAKARMVVTALWAVLWSSGRHFDSITAVRWLRRWSGPDATERLWLPLLRAKLGYCAETASATFIWATLRRLVTARLQGGGGDRFGYVPGGYAAVLAALRRTLEREGVQIHTGARVERVRRADGRLRVELDGAPPVVVDRVLLTTAAPVVAALCPDLRPEEHELLTGVPYLGVVCTSVLLRKPVSDAYITYVTDPKPFTAVIEMTELVPPAELAGHTLVYLPRYTSPDDPLFDRDDDAVADEFLTAFLPMYGLDDDDVVSATVARARLVLPVPTPGYRGRVPSVVTSLEGVYTISSAQIVDGTLNVEETLRLLETTWPELARSEFGKPTEEG